MRRPNLHGNSTDIYKAELDAANTRLERYGFVTVEVDEVAIACSIAANEPLTSPENVADLLRIRQRHTSHVPQSSNGAPPSPGMADDQQRRFGSALLPDSGSSCGLHASGSSSAHQVAA